MRCLLSLRPIVQYLEGARLRRGTWFLAVCAFVVALAPSAFSSHSASAVGTPLQSTDPIAAVHNPSDNSNFRLTDVAVAPDGGIYVADRHLDIVGKITGSATSALQVIAGTSGAAGTGTDDTLATSFAITDPQQIAFDASGNLYFADSGNNRVIRVNSAGGGDGKARVIATGFSTPAGLAVAADRTLYVADGLAGGVTGVRKIWKVPYDAGSSSYGTPIAMFTGTGDKPTQSPYNDAFQKITLSADRKSVV